MVSGGLLPCLSECKPAVSVSTNLFDHKAVLLSLGDAAPPSTAGIPRLRNCNMNNPYLKYSVELAAYRCYSFGIRTELITDFWAPLRNMVTDMQNKTKIISEKLLEMSTMLKNYAVRDETPRDVMDVSALYAEIDLAFQDLPSLDHLSQLPKISNSAVFFEAFAEETKKAGIKSQKTLAYIQRLKKNRLITTIETLSENFEANYAKIRDLEKELGNICDLELRDKLQELKIFEILNAEKSSPHFLELAKKTSTIEKLTDICNAEGKVLLSGDDLNKYITNFYSNLYRPDNFVRGEIADFLGADIVQHPLVCGSILTHEEREKLDSNLTILELDKSLDQANLKSAPGVDGFSYGFIKNFWNIYRQPLHECAKNSLETQSLPPSFLTAQIKLIPKKGDIKKIGNWRPISLLSNFYKIVSRAINNRLKEISNRILSRAQKGFNQKRLIQETIINTLETMEYCQRENIKGVLVSIDQSKAFDSVSHEFMTKVYDFFGFGEKIKSWLKSIGTGRNACIILGQNTYSSCFDLGKGHAQGDSPSPLLYNFAAQILLFKIELAPDIKSIRPHKLLPGPIKPDTPFENKSNRETDKSDCFADDNTVGTLFEYSCLKKLKEILEQFKILSGLKTNFEKTALMRVGNLEGEIPENIRNLGFTITDSIKLLGFIIPNRGNISTANFEPVKKKIRGIIRYWDRFYLSLAGKITVYKTLLLPQLNYISTILMPDPETITEISALMENFVTQGFSIAKKKTLHKNR